MNAPLVITGPVLRDVLARAAARHQASEVRGWKRRHAPSRVRRVTSAVLVAAFIVWALVAVFAVVAAFDL